MIFCITGDFKSRIGKTEVSPGMSTSTEHESITSIPPVMMEFTAETNREIQKSYFSVREIKQ